MRDCGKQGRYVKRNHLRGSVEELGDGFGSIIHGSEEDDYKEEIELCHRITFS